jgi:hypothetical protein
MDTMGDSINQSASGNASVGNMIGKIVSNSQSPHELINLLRQEVERAVGSGDLDAAQARQGRMALNEMQTALDDDGPDRGGRFRRALRSFTDVTGHVARLAGNADDISTAVQHLL